MEQIRKDCPRVTYQQKTIYLSLGSKQKKKQPTFNEIIFMA